jgi:uncharacterized protein with PQ loop repeat
MALNPVILWILNTAGPVCFFFMQFSLLRTIVHLIQTKNEEQVSSIPFLALFTNGSCWAIYSFMMGEIPLFIPNASGTLVGLFCVIMYHIYSAYPVPLTHDVLSIGTIMITIISTLIGYFSIVTAIAVFLTVFLMGSPLAATWTVIKDKSTRSMPFLASMASFCSATSWACYGFFAAKDWNVACPALLGLLLAIFQLGLFAVYGFDRPLSEMRAEISNGSAPPTPIPMSFVTASPGLGNNQYKPIGNGSAPGGANVGNATRKESAADGEEFEITSRTSSKLTKSFSLDL